VYACGHGVERKAERTARSADVSSRDYAAFSSGLCGARLADREWKGE
jgi:hypothetical protein